MIVQKEFLNKLKQFGLNSYEVKIWVALLSRGISTAGELADISNVPRSRSYDVLESLEKKGFIIMKVGKPIKYIAVTPSEVLERVKKRIEEDAKSSIKAMDNLRESDILSELNALHGQGAELVEPTDLSGSLKGRGNVYNQMESMIKAAEKSIIIMTTTEGLIRKYDNFKVHLEKAAKRGVDIKIAAPIAPETDKIAKELSRFAKIKHVEKVDARFCLVDGSQLAFMLSNENIDPSYDSGLWVNTDAFSRALETMFNETWNSTKIKEIKVDFKK